MNAKAVTKWDSQLFLAILLLLTLPSLYQSYGIYLIGERPIEQQHLAIAAQWQFVQVLLEIVQEGLVFPLFFLIGSAKEGPSTLVVERLITVFAILALTLLPLLVVFWWLAPYFVDYVGTSKEIQQDTVPYLRLKAIAAIVAILNIGLITALECLRLPRLVMAIAISKVFIYICSDSFFYGEFSCSMDLGIQGYAWSSVFVELMLLLLILFIFRYKLGPFTFAFGVSFSIKNWQNFFKISGWVVLESMVRNMAYFLIILRLTNLQGAASISGYYLSMHLLWGFALVPIMALSDVSKVLIANVSHDLKQVKRVLSTVIKYSGIVFLLWIIGLIFLDEILRFFTQDSNTKVIVKNTIFRLLPAYVILSMTLIVDSLFIGTGKTKYLALKSIYTNLLVYGSVYVVYRFEWWIPQYNELLAVFSVSIVVGMLFTLRFTRQLLMRMRN